MPKRVIQSSLAVPLCFAGVVVSAVVLYFSTSVSFPLLQTVMLIVSMAVVFFCTHPLAHHFSAMIFGVRTQYFFLGKSDFRKLSNPLARRIGGNLVTIGTKLDRSQLSSLGASRRGWIFGSGAIVSSILLGLPLLYAIIEGFNWEALLLGNAFFFGNVVVEALFSTKVGDLSKMIRELSRR